MAEMESDEREERELADARSVFVAPSWTLWSVISWLAFRNPNQITAISGLDELRARKLFPAYGPAHDPAMVDARPERTLLEAIQMGILVVIKDGAPIARETWFGQEPWSQGEVRFRREDVLKMWPTNAEVPTSHTILKTGTEGRPSSWYLVEREFRRRWPLERNLGVTKAEWAQSLHSWLHHTHPEGPQLTPKTIRNRLLKLIRELENEP